MTDKREQLIVKKALYEELVAKGPNKFKLIFDPISYATEAMQTIEEQIKSSKSPKRLQKLLCRYNAWKIEVDILRALEKENVDAKTNNKDS